VSFTGTPTTTTNNPSPAGRVQISLSTGDVLVFWMVNSSRAFFLDESTSAAEDGTADLQSTNSFSASTMNGQYAMVMDGIDLTPEALARIGTLQFDGSGNLTLVDVENDSSSGAGAQSPGAMAGTYQIGANGRITGSVSNGGSGLNFIAYAVSGSQAYVLEVDPDVNTSGTLQLQQ
jgi:hypothetical protein